MSEYERLEYNELSPAAQAFLRPDSSPGARLAAARGLVPLLTADLASLLLHLTGDADPRIGRQARRTLRELPPNLLETILGSPATNPKVLDYFARQKLPEPRLYERLLFNRATADPTVAWLAGHLDQISLLDLVASNQERMIRHPAIVRELVSNRYTSPSTVARVRQFYILHTGSDELFRELERKPEPAAPVPKPEPAAEPSGEAPAPAFDETAEAEAFEALPDEEAAELGGLSLDDLEKEDFDSEAGFAREFMVDPERELSAEERIGMLHKIRAMNVVDQMRLALHGATESRQILIKSSNKLIQEAVLRNPRITIEEIIKLARDKSMREELIRIICINKDWTKNYQVRLNLAWNPKTPLTMAIKYLNLLNEKDLAMIGKSKAVPGMVAVTARKMVSQKQKFR